MKVYNFPVVITQDEDGIYMAKVTTLPGCHTQAKTLPVVYKRIEEAIELCLEVERAKKHYIPQEKFIGIQQIEVSV
ncbi:type II toxin-antitoxin system HicB family antitoxin [Candidatus Peregrinibacteria bacterium]|nr:type II toxin-antitoxin system HicB family antitoxin [Candidatus Peregrinibacteria bacterium]